MPQLVESPNLTTIFGASVGATRVPGHLKGPESHLRVTRIQGVDVS